MEERVEHREIRTTNQWGNADWECVDACGPRDLRWFAWVNASDAEAAALAYADGRWEATGTSPRVVACRQRGSEVVQLVTLKPRPRPVLLVHETDVGDESVDYFGSDRPDDGWAEKASASAAISSSGLGIRKAPEREKWLRKRPEGEQ